MPEIDVSFLLTEDAGQFSASRMELGEDAGRITWRNALNSADLISLTPEEILEAKDHIREYGAWSDEEIDSWTDEETKALIVQFAAGDYREAESCCWSDELHDIDWDGEYQRQAQEGSISGNLYMSDGKLYLMFCS
jgi:hypothetical protein